MRTGKICSFFGHRNIKITNELKERLTATIIDLIENKGVEIFYFGGFGDFDELCHQVVSELKLGFKNIKRIFCLSDVKYLNPLKRPRWLKSEDYEEFVYLDLAFDWWYNRIYFRNIEMIKQSDYIIFYAEKRKRSGAYKAFEYAKKINKNFINLFDESALG